MEELREELHSEHGSGEKPSGNEAAILRTRSTGWLTDEERLANMERRGLLKRGKGKIPEDFLSRARPQDPEGDVLAALLDERHSEQ